MATPSNSEEPRLRELPAELFERLNPELYLQRHIDAGERPCGRGFSEFRPITIQAARDEQLASGSIGAAVARAGACVVMCGIRGGLTELEGQGGVHVTVETQRSARTTLPPPEEMVLSERAQNLVRRASWPKTAFSVQVPGGEHMIYRELVLSASIRVLSRTGPCFDVVWAALVAALRETQLPQFYFNEAAQKVCVQPDLPLLPLELPQDLPIYAATRGIYQNTNGKVILADLEGATEECCATGRITVSQAGNGQLTSLSMLLGKTPMSKSEFMKLLPALRKERAEVIAQ